MPIRYRCPNCDKLLRAGSRAAGRKIACPACGDKHRVPETVSDAGEPDHSPAAGSERRGGQSSGQVEDCESYFQMPAATSSKIAQPTPAEPQDSGLIERQFDEDEDEDEVGFSPQRRMHDSGELDLIPMVDCVFLLLVFYMISANYGAQKSISVAPPNAPKQGVVQVAEEEPEAPLDSVIVRIDEQNLVYVDDIRLPDRQTLIDVLTTRRAGSKDIELVVEADANALQESLVAVIDAAQDLKFEKVRVSPLGGSDAQF